MVQSSLRLTAMGDDDRFYTYDNDIRFNDNNDGFGLNEGFGLVVDDPGMMGPASAVDGSRSTANTSIQHGNLTTQDNTSANQLVDELQALNTALCFLCSVNADSTEVEHFLKLHPEALLLEGACLLPEDNAHYILQQRELRCTCPTTSSAETGGNITGNTGSTLCRANRDRVLDLLNVGFAKFQARREDRSQARAWAAHFGQLVQAEHDIRILRRQELSMRNTLAETAVEVRCYQDELDQVYRLIESLQQSQLLTVNSRPSTVLARLGCVSGAHRNSNNSNSSSSNSHNSRSSASSGHSSAGHNSLERRAAVLEYQVGVASVNLRSVEREHANLLQRIRQGRRTQFAVLQRAFEGCRRHAICSNKVQSNNSVSSPSGNGVIANKDTVTTTPLASRLT